MISTVQVSNNRQLNTLITVHREVGRDSPKKRKRKKQHLHIVHTDKGKLIIIMTSDMALKQRNLPRGPTHIF